MHKYIITIACKTNQFYANSFNICNVQQLTIYQYISYYIAQIIIKYQKFISSPYIDMTKRHSLSFNDIHPINLEENQQMTRNLNQNNFLALKKLKETDQKIEKMKRRLKVIQIRQHEGDHLVKQMIQKQKLHQRIKQQMQRSRKQLQLKRIQEIRQIQQIKDKSITYRKQSQQKILQAKQFILGKRSQIQKYIRSQSKKNQQSIQKYRQLQLNQKKEKYKTMIQKQSQTKKKIDKYIQNKALTIKAKTSQQTLNLLRALKDRQRQLQELSKTQEKAVQQYRKKTAMNASRLNVQTQTSELSRINQQSQNSKRSVPSRQKNYPQMSHGLIILQQSE